MPHLPTIPEEEPKEEPETEIEPKFQPEIPEFEPDFQLTNTPDSTTPDPSPFNLSKILPPLTTEFILSPAVCRRKWATSMINMSAFLNIQPEAVERILWIPDGDHIYLIRCDKDHWHDKQIDGQPWQMTKSSCEGLNGIKKLALAEDHSYASTTTAQFIQWNGFTIRWIS